MQHQEKFWSFVRFNHFQIIVLFPNISASAYPNILTERKDFHIISGDFKSFMQTSFIVIFGFAHKFHYIK